MTKTRIRGFFYFFILFLIFLILYVPRGTTDDTTSVKFDSTGNYVMSFDGDVGSDRRLLGVPSLYSQRFSKEDWGYVAFYTSRISFNLVSVQEVSNNSLKAQLNMPGTIILVEGGSLVDGKAVFDISLGEKRNIVASSRQIRWHWIILTLVAIVGIAVFYIKRREIEKLQY